MNARDTNLTAALWLTLLYLLFKGDENWIYGVQVTPTLKMPPLFPIEGGKQQKKARAIEARQNRIKVP